MKNLMFISVFIMSLISVAQAKNLKVKCMPSGMTKTSKLYIKLAKRYALNMNEVEKLSKQDYDLSREFYKAQDRFENSELESFDVDAIEDRLNMSITEINERFNVLLVDSFYSLTPSSRDKDITPFGVVGVGLSEKKIADHCAAQMNAFEVDGISGDLFVRLRNGSKMIIAKLAQSLVQANTLNEIFGTFSEYQMVEDLILTQAEIKLRKASEIYFDRDEFVFKRYSYKFKDMKLVFKNTKTGKVHRFSSFK